MLLVLLQIHIIQTKADWLNICSCSRQIVSYVLCVWVCVFAMLPYAKYPLIRYSLFVYIIAATQKPKAKPPIPRFDSILYAHAMYVHGSTPNTIQLSTEHTHKHMHTHAKPINGPLLSIHNEATQCAGHKHSPHLRFSRSARHLLKHCIFLPRLGGRAAAATLARQRRANLSYACTFGVHICARARMCVCVRVCFARRAPCLSAELSRRKCVTRQ